MYTLALEQRSQVFPVWTSEDKRVRHRPRPRSIKAPTFSFLKSRSNASRAFATRIRVSPRSISLVQPEMFKRMLKIALLLLTLHKRE
jgi:hypothetical protein